MKHKRLSVILCAISAMAAMGAVVCAIIPDRERVAGPLWPAHPTVAFGRAVVGSPFVVSIPIHNRSREPVRIVGSAYTCTLQGCVQSIREPLTVPGRLRRDIRLGVLPRACGALELNTVLYTDCDTQREYPVTITAVVERQ